MKFLFAAVACCVAFTTSALAASPDQEKQFVDTYKKAHEAGDTRTLNALLYTKGSDPQALEFCQMSMAGDGGWNPRLLQGPLGPGDPLLDPSRDFHN